MFTVKVGLDWKPLPILYSNGLIPVVTFTVKVYSPVVVGHWLTIFAVIPLGNGSVAILTVKGVVITQPLTSLTYTSHAVAVAGFNMAAFESS